MRFFHGDLFEVRKPKRDLEPPLQISRRAFEILVLMTVLCLLWNL